MLERANKDRDRSSPGLDGDTRPVSFRGAGFTPKAGRWSGWLALLLVIGLWQLAGSAGWVNPLFLPTPVAIARAIWQLHQVQVFDGGYDGDPGTTSDNSVFMREGVFVP